MATLILHGDEKLENLVKKEYDDFGECTNKIIMDDIDVVIHRKGKETKILKSK